MDLLNVTNRAKIRDFYKKVIYRGNFYLLRHKFEIGDLLRTK